jgi:hypothetical protein
MIVKYRKGTTYFLSILNHLGKHRIIEVDSTVGFNGLFNGGFLLNSDSDTFIVKDDTDDLITLDGNRFYVTNQNSNNIVNIEGDIKVYNTDGLLLSTYMTEDSIQDYYFLEDGTFFIVLATFSNELKVLFFSGISNSFSERIFPDLNYLVDNNGQKSSTNSRNRLSEGSAAIYFYNEEFFFYPNF